MHIIVTEDTKLGYLFISAMVKAVYEDSARVFSSAYGNNTGNVGGFDRLPETIRMLIKDRIISKKLVDSVIILYDDISDRYEDKRKRYLDSAKVSDTIRQCKELLEKAGVNYEVNSCTCFEEAIFSFEYLSDFCDPTKKNHEKTITGLIYESIHSQYYKPGITKRGEEQAFNGLAGDYYRGLFKDLGWPFDSDTKTIEESIKTSLTKYMIKADFSNFAIKPEGSYLGQCWRLGCSKAKSGKDCSVCLVKGMRSLLSNPSSVRERLILFYKHSLFRSLF